VILFHPFNENQYQQRYLGLVIILRDMMERSYRPSFRIALAIMEEKKRMEGSGSVEVLYYSAHQKQTSSSKVERVGFEQFSLYLSVR
jgi:hypothetical protein